jgi:predicted thioesterase
MNKMKWLLMIAFAARAIAEAVDKALQDKKVTVGEAIEIASKAAEALGLKEKILFEFENREG